MFQHIGAVHLVLAVGDGQPNLVKARGPCKQQAIVGVQFPRRRNTIEQLQRRCFNPLGLRDINAIALHQGLHRGIARISVAAATQHVVQHAFA